MKKLGVSASFDEGCRAQAQGEKIEDNPYPKDDLDHQNWDAGHKTASTEPNPDKQQEPEL